MSSGPSTSQVQDQLMEADELQRWKVSLWLQIIQHNVESVKRLLDSASKNTKGLNTPIQRSGQTILNVAVRVGLEMSLIERLVELMPHNELDKKDQYGRTALHEAIHASNFPAANLLMKEEPGLVNIRDEKKRLPVELAAKKRHRDLTFSLHKVTIQKHQFYIDTETNNILYCALSAELYDFVLHILKGNPDLEPDSIMNLLDYFVNEPRAFQSTSPLNVLQSCIYSLTLVSTTEIMESFQREEMITSSLIPNDEKSISGKLKVLLRKKIWGIIGKPVEDIRQAKIRHLLALEISKNLCWRLSYSWEKSPSLLKNIFLQSAENGIHKMVKAILHAYPPAIELRNDEGHSALDIAAMYRHEKVFRIAWKSRSSMGLLDLKDKDKKEALTNTLSQSMVLMSHKDLLFQVAYRPRQSRLETGTGIVFQMQRELRWFKELENLLPDQRKSKNKAKKTPIEVFKEEHQDLVDYENNWMQGMANSCIVAGSLMITIAFAAAITVPGGNKDDTGLPFFLTGRAYKVFAFSNALSLIFSVCCVLIFLSIFTSRHTINDYLYSLPSKLIFGLIFLFLSLTSLMVDFASIVYIVSGPSYKKNAFIIVALACLPVCLFVYLQMPSLANMIRSTYVHRHFIDTSKNSDELFYSPV